MRGIVNTQPRGARYAVPGLTEGRVLYGGATEIERPAGGGARLPCAFRDGSGEFLIENRGLILTSGGWEWRFSARSRVYSLDDQWVNPDRGVWDLGEVGPIPYTAICHPHSALHHTTPSIFIYFTCHPTLPYSQRIGNPLKYREKAPGGGRESRGRPEIVAFAAKQLTRLSASYCVSLQPTRQTPHALTALCRTKHVLTLERVSRTKHSLTSAEPQPQRSTPERSAPSF